MNESRILVLDANPGESSGRAIVSALNSAALSQAEARYQIADEHPAAQIARCDPLLAVLVLGPSSDRREALVSECAGVEPGVPLLVASEPCAFEEVIGLLRAGASDFLMPPWTQTGIVPRIWRMLSQHGESGQPDSSLRRSPATRHMVGESSRFMEELEKLPVLGSCDANLLILGETGCGKELFARAVHHLSRRNRKPLIPVNCGAIPTDLLENELFGHESGAYTSAASAQPGLMGEADGGTLLLDEFDALPPSAQVKLLRFLESKEYRPLGSPKLRHADVRVIAATNANVDHAVKEGKLRLDLYYRLNVVSVRLPALRERIEDVPLLARHFLRKYESEYGRPPRELSPGAMEKLLLHRWPGNVRELQHVIERAVAMARGSIIEEHDLALARVEEQATGKSFREAKAEMVVEFEKSYIRGLLVACSGNITKAAESARKDRRAFFELIRKHRIDVSPLRKHDRRT